MPFSKLGDALDNDPILFSRAVIFSAGIGILGGSPRVAFFPGETTAGQRAIGGHGDIIFSAQTEELSFIFTHNQVVVALHRDKGRQPFAFGKGVRFRKLPCIAIGNTNSAHFPAVTAA